MKNDAILEDAKKWIFNKLLQNKPIFRKLGAEGIRKRIDQNIQEIQTNELDYNYNGWCDLNNPVITLNTQDSDSRLLTMEEIKNKPGLEATLLHEAIHAALKNKNGTGMLYVFNEEEQDLLRKKHGRCAFLL